VNTGKPARNVVKKGRWEEVSEKVALEKCKQSLREQQREEPEIEEGDHEGFLVVTREDEKKEEEAKQTRVTFASLHDVGRRLSSSTITSSDAKGASLARAAAAASTSVLSSVSTTTPTSVPESMTRPKIIQPFEASMASFSAARGTHTAAQEFGSFAEASTVDHRVSLLQLDLNRRVLMRQQQVLQQQQRMMAKKPLYSLQQFNPKHPFQNSAMSISGVAQTRSSSTERMPLTIPQGLREEHFRKILEARAREILSEQAEPQVMPRHPQKSSPVQHGQLQPSTRQRPATNRVSTIPPTSHSMTAQEEESEDAVAALAALTYADQPKITEQEVEMELASLKDDERAKVLADIFGAKCAVNTHQTKRARKDLDEQSIKFLIDYMKREIEKTPVKKKLSLLEALSKCPVHEFSDERLEQFLIREGMNAKV